MSKQSQIKIISDGTGYGTLVLDFDGRPIRGISSVKIEITSDGLATALLVFDNVALELEAQADLSQVAKNDGSE